ncbi:MAG: Flp pilus assembly protein CpaB [Armatimonadetes bacterium]|nr:Flp pilus assembly protein CpaB [Armatimonadota bacterium]MDI9587340.1 Flp pilus assembly protein CpaB [Acidobacteriota bacterium]
MPMRLTRRAAVGIAIICGALAALLAVVYLQGQRKPAAPEPPKTVEVVVPRVDIPARTVITEDMLSVMTVKVEEVPRLPVKTPQSIVGYVAVENLSAQRPVSQSQVMARGSAFGLSGMVPGGMRAVTVEVDPVTGVAGLLKAGDHVDIIATFEVGDQFIARTILQDIELLALGAQTVASTSQQEKRLAAGQATTGGAAAPDKEGAAESAEEEGGGGRTRAQAYPNATLAVTPEDAQKLILADLRGDLRLVLRPVGEYDFVPVPVHDMTSVAGPEYAAILKAQNPPEEKKEEAKPEPAPVQQPMMAPPWSQPSTAPAAKPEKKKPEVEIIRGDTTTRVVP